jgi:NAD(P)-dependent dehydrogenase (short-subunit alcohol dehydrogenase family)
MELNLTNKTALVTGGSKGIGLAVATALAKEGARVAVAARGATPELKELMNEYDVEHFAVDLADPRGPARLVAAVASSYGALDLLVNNVGASEPAATSLAFTDEQWQRLFEINFFGVVRTVRAAVPLLAANGDGAVVNIASLNARLPQGMIAPYSAAKAALVNFGKAVSEELAPQGVRVNSILPGPVRTPLWTDPGGFAHIIGEQAGISADEVMDRMLPESMNISLGRVAAPEEIADLVLFLCSPRSSYVTGAEYVIGGGMLKSTA